MIAGVNKAGTTSLFHALATHPEVDTSKVKETHFFDPIKYGETAPPLEAYARFFPQSGIAPVVLSGHARVLLRRPAPGGRSRPRAARARIVVVLREPGSRAFSWWRFCRSGLLLDPALSFGEYLERCAS